MQGVLSVVILTVAIVVGIVFLVKKKKVTLKTVVRNRVRR